MINFINKFITNHSRFVFISPHLDDAAFSAGGLIAYLSGKNIGVTVINIFTSAGDQPCNSLSAKMFLKQCGYQSASRLFADRISEDRKTFARFPSVKVINLGFTDALWRVNPGAGLIRKLLGKFIPEFVNIYPTYRWHISRGQIRPPDEFTIQNIVKIIIPLLSRQSVIFTPLGIGQHVDHLVTRSASMRLNLPLVYWADYPYVNSAQSDSVFISDHRLQKFEFSAGLKQKQQLIAGYYSQVLPVFGTKNPQPVPDIFYYHQ